MRIDRYDIRPLTPERHGDFETVLGGSGQRGCWCMYWILGGSKAFMAAAKGGAQAPNRAAFRARVAQGPPPGLLAYEGAEPAGWLRVMPRRELPGLANSRFFRTDLPIEGVWSLSCFVVRAPWRGRGLTGILTRGAIEHARRAGATALEAYPTETGDRLSAAAAYLGVASTFRRLGFEEVQRRAPHKPMLRLSLS